MSIFTTLIFNIVLEILPRAIRQENEAKSIHTGKKERNNVLTDDTIIYIENPKEFTKKLRELTSEFGMVIIYKVSM